MPDLPKELSPVLKGVVLEVGCGRGELANLIVNECKEIEKYYALDPYLPELKKLNGINKINKLYANLDCKCIKDGIIDFIVLGNILHHTNEPELIIKLLKNKIKKNGKIIIVESVSDNLTIEEETLKEYHHFIGELDKELGFIHNLTYQTNEFIRLIEQNEMQIERLIHIHEIKENTKNEDEPYYLQESINGRLNKLLPEVKIKYENRAKLIIENVKQNGIKRARQVFLIARNKSL